MKGALNTNLFEIRLFGSKATGKFHGESDIDVLIIVHKRDEITFDVISEILLDVELKYDCMISPVVFSVKEFLQNQKHQTLFYNEIARDGAMNHASIELAIYRIQKAYSQLQSAQILF